MLIIPSLFTFCRFSPKLLSLKLPASPYPPAKKGASIICEQFSSISERLEALEVVPSWRGQLKIYGKYFNAAAAARHLGHLSFWCHRNCTIRP